MTRTSSTTSVWLSCGCQSMTVPSSSISELHASSAQPYIDKNKKKIEKCFLLFVSLFKRYCCLLLVRIDKHHHNKRRDQNIPITPYYSDYTKLKFTFLKHFNFFSCYHWRAMQTPLPSQIPTSALSVVPLCLAHSALIQ